MMKRRFVLLIACVFCHAPPIHAAALSTSQASCDRQCLDQLAAAYLEALKAHDPARLPLAANVKFTENNVVLPIGRGLWRTVSGDGAHGVIATDLVRGEVVLSAVIAEGDHTAILLARLRVEDGRLTEIETLVGRRDNTPWLEPIGWYQMAPLLEQEVDPARRTARDVSIDIENRYFDRLTDATRPTPPLDERCNRIENGVRTTNNPDPFPGRSSSPLSAEVTRMSCAEHFALNKLGFVTRVRNRRYGLVDEAKGISLAMVIFDHDGDIGMVAAGDAAHSATLSSPQPSPASIMVGEVFKVEAGKIVLIQALLIALPYGMTSSW